jgi:hypothetical protein
MRGKQGGKQGKQSRKRADKKHKRHYFSGNAACPPKKCRESGKNKPRILQGLFFNQKDVL